MEDFDIFAGVEDFCQNFTLEIPKSTALEIHSEGESSNSDAEALFTVKTKGKPAGKQKNKSKSKIKRKPGTDDGIQKTTGKTRRKSVNDENDSIINDSVPEITSPRRARGRQRRQTDETDSVEEYMALQTAATLAIQNAPVTGSSQRGRARRRYMSDRACKQRVVATIDLAGPQTPTLPPRSSRGKNPISSGLDDDLIISLTDPCADDSFDFENEEIGVKIRWGDQIEIIPLRRHQKFADLMQELAQRKDVVAKDILLNINDKIIGPNDTIDSINYNIAQFISGRNLVSNDCYAPTKKKDPNVIKVKIQSNAFKRPMEFSMKKDQQFKVLYIKCSEQLKIACDSIKLSFDGDPLILHETPNDLDLEGGEMIDCRIKN